MRRDRSDDPAGQDFREELFAQLRKLVPTAITQAKKGKPALLRILTRYSPGISHRSPCTSRA